MNVSKSRWVVNQINRVLKRSNLKLDTLTASRAESRRLDEANVRQWFTRPVFPLPHCFLSSSHRTLLDEVSKHRSRFDSFHNVSDNDVGYQFGNPYFGSPDAEILYSIMRCYRPRHIVEIGCGHSTKLIHQAVKDGGFPCEHTCIDPHPRQDVSRFADKIIAKRIESMDAAQIAGGLVSGDVLFIDTSHEARPANDVAFIYGCMLPQVAPGVIVHIHDIFLPYDYPYQWVSELGYDWGELYIVQALLSSCDAWEALWPGYYLQRTLPGFASHFPHLRGGMAQSLWLRKK